MTRPFLILVVLMVGGCGCGEMHLEGESDADLDTAEVGGIDGDDVSEDGLVPDLEEDTELECDGWTHSWPHTIVNDKTCVYGMDCADSNIEWAGGWMAVTWNNARGYFTRVDESGTEAHPDVELQAVGTNLLDEPHAMSMAWTGSGFGAVWLHRFGSPALAFGTFGEGGEVLSPPVLLRPSANDIKCGAVSWNGSAFGVTWVEEPEEGPSVKFTVVDEEGTELTAEALLNDPDPYIQIATSYFENRPGPATVWTGEDFAIAWIQSDGSLKLARLDSDAVLVDSTVIVSDYAYLDHVDMAWTGSELALTWNGLIDSVADETSKLYITRVGAEGVRPPVFLLPEFGTT